ncbi:ROK family transcriptional regulator [Sphingomonas montana]|uniref:ROK family transcriptional regulator n=1 Tax=Sphingomonas montana TaxID=1843236 RepID=UPI00096F9CCF|nr:ROK family transcriptional regulator [Sphingomonas montana]
MKTNSPSGATPTGRPGAVDHGARLGVSLSGTNLERAGDYNQRTVLQAIRVSGEASRTDLAAITGLTAPTIANITRRLLDAGLIAEAGRRQGARGQPAAQLVINPGGGFSIGVNIDRDHITIVSLDLAGTVLTRATREVAFPMPDDVAAWLGGEITAIRASDLIDERRMLGVGVALPDDLGRVTLPHRPAGYEIWNDVDVAALVGTMVPWPVHVDNDAAAAAIGEAQFGSGMVLPSFFYVLVSAGLGGGLVIDGSYFRGAGRRSGEIGFMPDMTRRAAGRTVQETVSLSALYARLEKRGCAVTGVDALTGGDPVVAAVIRSWTEDAAQSLIEPLIAVSCLVDPAAILIGGRLPAALVDALVDRLNVMLADAGLPSDARVRRAAMSHDAPAVGAAILPFLDHILPSDAILMQAGRTGGLSERNLPF